MRPFSAFAVIPGVLATASTISALACARHGQPHPEPSAGASLWRRQPEALSGLQPEGWRGPASLPDAVVADGAPESVDSAGVPTHLRVSSFGVLDAATIPDGDGCLQQLKALGVAFRQGPNKRGLKTPVLVGGPLGGVIYSGRYGVSFLCDCRLAVALSWVGSELRSLGISEVLFSGAYNYRTSRVGRLSLHAYGLAIDIHEVTVRGKRQRLTHDYERRLDDPCNSSRVLNRVACRLRARGLFYELLTPDYDADHHDHFHLSIKPHGEDPVARTHRPKQATAGAGKSADVREVPRRKRGKQRVVSSDRSLRSTRSLSSQSSQPIDSP